jgi:hypothetical protein
MLLYTKPFLHGSLVASSSWYVLLDKHVESRIHQYRQMYEENLNFLEEEHHKELTKLKNHVL